MVPMTKQNAVDSGTVRHVLVVGALELKVKDRFVFEQQHQIRAPLQDFGQIHVQKCPDLHATGQLVQQARMIFLE